MRNTAHTTAVRRAVRDVPDGPAKTWLMRLLTHGERGGSARREPAAAKGTHGAKRAALK